MELFAEIICENGLTPGNFSCVERHLSRKDFGLRKFKCDRFTEILQIYRFMLVAIYNAPLLFVLMQAGVWQELQPHA